VTLRKKKKLELSRIAYVATLQFLKSQDYSHHSHLYLLLLLLLLLLILYNMHAKIDKYEIYGKKNSKNKTRYP
jgi:fucose permease